MTALTIAVFYEYTYLVIVQVYYINIVVGDYIKIFNYFHISKTR